MKLLELPLRWLNVPRQWLYAGTKVEERYGRIET